jgi:hypothetical protein
LTLYSVYNAKLQINGDSFEVSLLNFFDKIRALASENTQQSLVLSGMIFTFVIWLFSMLSLLLAALFFVFFLWHYIPRTDGGLSGYCERKANKRLLQIVSIKINKAMRDDEMKRRKAELKSAKKNGGDRPISMKATLPNVELDQDKLPEMPVLHRNDTIATLPPYTSRPGTPGSIELSALDQKRPLPARTATAASSASQYSSQASLLSGAADFGITRTASPAPTLPHVDLNNYPPMRTGTSNSNRSFGGPQLNRMPTNGSLASSRGNYQDQPPFSQSNNMPAMPPAVRSQGNGPNGYRNPGRPELAEYPNGRSSPAPSVNSYRGESQSPRGPGLNSYPNGYPARSATNPMPLRGPQPYPPQRNMTAPLQPQHQPTSSNSSLRNMVGPGQQYQQGQDAGQYDYFNRPGTANSQRPAPRGGFSNNGWDQDTERGGPRY